MTSISLNDALSSLAAEKPAATASTRPVRPTRFADFRFTPPERSAVVAALRGFGVYPVTDAMLAGIELAITKVREGDAVGTVRVDGTKYAFTYARGKHVLIDTNPAKPAYKPASVSDEAEIAGWPLAKTG